MSNSDDSDKIYGYRLIVGDPYRDTHGNIETVYVRTNEPMHYIDVCYSLFAVNHDVSMITLLTQDSEERDSTELLFYSDGENRISTKVGSMLADAGIDFSSFEHIATATEKDGLLFTSAKDVARLYLQMARVHSKNKIEYSFVDSISGADVLVAGIGHGVLN